MPESREENIRISRQVAERIRTIRQDKRLSVESVARQAGLHPENYRKMERGGRDLRVSTFVRVLKALSVTWAEFEEWE